MRPKLSRIHCTSAPVMATLPSRAYTRRLPAQAVSHRGEHAVARRLHDLVPVFMSRKHPVPYVFLASPARKQVWPTSAAC